MVNRTGCILIIEPNAQIRRLITTLLRALDIRQVLTARTAAAVDLSAFTENNAPDLIILDWGTDPTEATLFAHRIRGGAYIDCRTPILGLSSSLHHSVLEQAWQAGIDDLVGRPLSAIEILQRVAALLHERWTWQPSQDIIAAE